MADTSPEKEELLPLPSKDLPLPEKELTANNQSRNFLGSKWLRIGILAVIIAFAVSGAYFLGKNNVNQQVACTQEAKLCPDGSSVGRTGPKCEFSPCPAPTSSLIDTSDWITFTNAEYGVSIEYPSTWSFAPDIFNNLYDDVLFSIHQDPNNSNGGSLILYKNFQGGFCEGSQNIQNSRIIFNNGTEGKQTECEGEIGVSYQTDKDDFRLLATFVNDQNRSIIKRMISAFQFTNSTCKPRPACLDATPKCLIPETSDMCPAKVTPSE